MGKKTKVGKQRKDVFYNLAKETGYRSRAAFKLIQLNRKFQFLEKTRICVDLCAAPGGWMQVAQQHMPVSSFIIGIDLDPIKAIPKCQSFRCDITTDECRQLLKRELKTWKADTFLNDGAPNVGKSWDHDAFMQNCLTLSALKLATEFLNKGGYFVTKIFRSKDYNALIWVLNKLFRKVHATKPKASRSESAEIFVVCEDYLAPDHIDPKFFQSNYLFKDVQNQDETKKAKKEFLKPVEKQKKIKATGYDDNQFGLLDVKLKISEFLESKNHVELLSKANQIVFDNKMYLEDPLTTEIIKEYCNDIKVLSRKEILELLKWQKSMKKKYIKETEEDQNKNEAEEIDDNEIETEESQMDKLLKKRKKKILKEKRKLIERMNLKMVHKDDNPIEDEETGLFSLKMLDNKKELDRIENELKELEEEEDEKLEFESDDEDEKNLSKSEKRILQKLKEQKVKYIDKNKRLNLDEFDTAGYDSDEDDLDEFGNKINEDKRKNLHKSKVLKDKINSIENKLKTNKLKELNYDKNNVEEFELSDSQEENDSDEEEDFDNEMEIDDNEQIYNSDNEDDNDLLVDLDNKQNLKLTKKKMFLEQGLLKNANFDDDIEFDLVDVEDSKKKLNKNKKDKNLPNVKQKDLKTEINNDDETEMNKKKIKQIKLDANGLALGTLMKRSNKAKRDIENEAWNRYTRCDEDLPSWFAKDEAKHFRKPIIVPENLVKEYQTKLKDINVRTCKKVAEAKARKKHKALKVMEKLRKKTEAITDNDEMTEKEKVANIKRLYKKSLKGQEKKKPALVVAKRGRNNNRRPKGVKGRYKMVDARLKKDKRGQQKQQKLGKKPTIKKRLQKKPRLNKSDLD